MIFNINVCLYSREMLTGQRLCQSKSHQDSVLSALNQQRKDGLLCDVTLVAGEQKFHAHKAVLAACSDYFRVSPPVLFLFCVFAALGHHLKSMLLTFYNSYCVYHHSIYTSIKSQYLSDCAGHCKIERDDSNTCDY